MKYLPKKLRDLKALEAIAADFRAQCAAAEKITDPADKIEALLKLRQSANEHAAELSYACASRAVNFSSNTLGLGVVGSVVAGLALTVVATPLVGLPVLFGGIAAFFVVDYNDVIEKKMMDGMTPPLKGYIDALNDTLDKTSSGIDVLLKTRSNEIAASEKFDSIYDNFPSVRDNFIKTFNKAVARKELPPTPAPPNPAPKFAL